MIFDRLDLSQPWNSDYNLRIIDEPLQPSDITEDVVRQMVDNGEEVLFIKANAPYGYGVVTVEGGKLAFYTWEEALDREGAVP
jgi:hypothetical protein